MVPWKTFKSIINKIQRSSVCENKKITYINHKIRENGIFMTMLNEGIKREPNKRKKTIRIGNHKYTGEIRMPELEE